MAGRVKSMDAYLERFIDDMLENLEYRNGIFAKGWNGVHAALLIVFSLPVVAIFWEI